MLKGLRIACLLVFSLWGTALYAQELNCSVQVDDRQVESQERRVFREMEITFAQF